MNRINTDVQHRSSTAASRMDIYRGIHKAVRAYMCDTLTMLGRLDIDDRQDVAAAVAQVRGLAIFCAGHLAHENQFVHPAVEARRPGSSDMTTEDHSHYVEAHALATALEQASGESRATAVAELQRFLAQFVAENLTHMNVEESWNNAVLWETHSDAELIAIEQAIVGSPSPDELAICLHWMITGMNPAERRDLLAGIRQTAPAPAFEGVLALARDCLGARDWNKLATALAQPQRLVA